MFCDVRDVALAHILAATLPHASGRYIVSQPVSINAKHVTDILKVRVYVANLPLSLLGGHKGGCAKISNMATA